MTAALRQRLSCLSCIELSSLLCSVPYQACCLSASVFRALETHQSLIAFSNIPTTSTNNRLPLALSQLGLSPIGGHSLPSFFTLGLQVQRSSSGTLSRTMGMWLPQPHHVFFSVSYLVGIVM